MMKSCLALLLAAVALPLSAQELVDEAPPPEMTEIVAFATAAAEAGGTGPYPAEMLVDPSLPTHTIYRPRNMAAAGGPLPIIAWGNGACTNIGNRFRYLLTEIASHGYVVIAVGPMGPPVAEWKANLNANNDVPPAQRMPGSYAAQLTDAIDWALAENAREGSEFYGRLDDANIAVAGQSCGGLQAIAAAADRRVRTALVLNSGTFSVGTPPLAGTGDATKLSLARLRGPTLWLSGDESDVAYPNAQADFIAATAVPGAWLWHTGTGHSTHYRAPHGGLFAPVVLNWLDWQLKGEADASAAFLGANCGWCTAEGWHVSTRGF